MIADLPGLGQARQYLKDKREPRIDIVKQVQTPEQIEAVKDTEYDRDEGWKFRPILKRRKGVESVAPRPPLQVVEQGVLI